MEDAITNLIESVSFGDGSEFNYIIESGGYIQDQATYYPGTYIASSAGSFTMGYKGIIEDPITGDFIKGFWTAGHCVENPGNAVWVSDTNTYLGSCSARMNSGYVDAAFIKLDDQDYTIISSDLLYGGKTLTSNHWVVEFPEEGLVYMCGGASKAEKAGYIKDTSYNFYSNETEANFYDFLVANYSSINGDSGSAVYMLVNGDYALCGIHRGLDPETAGRRVLTKTANINDEWKMYAWAD